MDFVLPLLIGITAVALAASAGNGTPTEKWRRFATSLRRQPLTWVLLAGTGYCGFVGLFWLMNFFVADSPSQALAKWHRTLPPDWEAGVMNHGEYFRWITISGHPFAFAGALLWLIGSIAASGYLSKRLGWTSNNRSKGRDA